MLERESLEHRHAVHTRRSDLKDQAGNPPGRQQCRERRVSQAEAGHVEVLEEDRGQVVAILGP
eukprot:scaffold3953_cov236-Pinguiococcus_pyrenoidosus.AAC.4